MINVSERVPVGILPAGVDLNLFSPEKRTIAFRKKLLGSHHGKGTLGIYAGRLGKEKNIEQLKSLLALPDFHLVIVGSGLHEADLRSHFLSRRVHFLGALEGEALAEAYASSDLFVMPSTTETLGVVCLEAVASGLPVVGADAGGIPGILNQISVGASLYDPASDDALLEAVRSMQGLLESDGPWRHELRSFVEDFSWENSVDSLTEFYRSVLG